MTRFLLDTNIISHVTKPSPAASLLQWMADQPDEDLFIATLSIGEIQRGIFQMQEGRKRRALELWFSGPTGPQALFKHRVLSFDEAAALVWAQLMADGTVSGRPRNALDMIIAAIATVNDCTVVTANEKDFRGAVAYVNPVRSGAT
jgi:predicted nucleic acid-binding protein